MSFFDDDPFDSIMRDFFDSSPIRRGRRREQFIRGEEEDRVIDFIESEDYVYLIFELPGYDERDVAVVVRGGEIEIVARKSNGENVQDYLNQKLRQGVQLRKKLPEFVEPKNFSQTMRNGVLELVFSKTNGGRRDERRKIKVN